MKKVLFAFFILAGTTLVNAQENKMAAKEAENKNAPEFKFDMEVYDFGTAKQGDVIKYDFTFVNTGKEPLIISNASGSCGCTVPSYPKEPIAKGAKGTIHVEFNSTGKMGMQDKTITIVSNAKGGQKVLHIKGNVEAAAPSESK